MNNLTNPITANATKKAIKFMHRYSDKFTKFWYDYIINNDMIESKVISARKCPDKSKYSYIKLLGTHRKTDFNFILHKDCDIIIIYKLEDNLYLIISDKYKLNRPLASILYLDNSKLAAYIKHCYYHIFKCDDVRVGLSHSCAIDSYGEEEYMLANIYSCLKGE